MATMLWRTEDSVRLQSRTGRDVTALWMGLAVAGELGDHRGRCPPARRRVQSVAGFSAAVRLLRVVRLLIVLAHRVHWVGIVLFGVAVRAGAGVPDHIAGE